MTDSAQHHAPIGFPQAAPPTHRQKGLAAGALGLVSSIVIGLASTAPAYSLAASLGYVVATPTPDGIVGVKAPAIMLLAFVPMLFIAIAYSEFNKVEPDCGTTFTWAARAFGPRTGWLGGWGIVVSDVIIMANLAQIAGSYSFHLVGLDELGNNRWWSMLGGVVWIIAMTWICYIGIEVSAKLQYWLLGIELVILAAFSGFAMWQVNHGSAPEGSLKPQWDWLSPTGLDTRAMVSALIIAIFIYWGWDTAVAVNEETEDSSRIPGLAAIVSTLALVATYVGVSIATVAFAGTGDTEYGLANPDNADDVFTALGATVFGDSAMGHVFLWLLMVSIMTSAAACTLTTILPTARTTLSMAVFRALPKSFAKVHPKYLTPSVSTLWMGGVSIAFYVALTFLSENVLADSIAAVGLEIAFYYGLTGFAAAWFFRHELRNSVRDFLMKGLFPLLGGVMLLAAFVVATIEYANPDYGYTVIWGIGGVAVIGIGGLLLGVILMVWWQRREPSFFNGDTLAAGGPSDLVLSTPDGEPDTWRLPDSGFPDIVIAPDLSNLPEGAVAEDLHTGLRLRRGDTAEMPIIVEGPAGGSAPRPPKSTDESHGHRRRRSGHEGDDRSASE